MAGRPTKPRHIKEAQGTLEKSREVDNPITRQALSKVPNIPDIIPDRGKEYFIYCCKALIEDGLLSAAIINKAVRAASWYADFVKASKAIDEHGYIQTTKSGYDAISPHLTMKERAEKYLTEFEREYGLTLASSQKLSMPTKKPDDELFD